MMRGSRPWAGEEEQRNSHKACQTQGKCFHIGNELCNSTSQTGLIIDHDFDYIDTSAGVTQGVGCKVVK